jgi:hypothetical protein
MMTSENVVSLNRFRWMKRCEGSEDFLGWRDLAVLAEGRVNGSLSRYAPGTC